VSRGQRGGSLTVVNLSFLDPSRYFFFQVAPHLSSQGLSDPVPDLLLRRKCCSVGKGARDLWVSSHELWPRDHRGGPSIIIVSNAELYNLYSSPSIIRIVKSRRIRWAGHVARMGEKRNVYSLLVGKPEGKRPLGRPRRRWIDDIKMDPLEI
jgi:hypothetical protein